VVVHTVSSRASGVTSVVSDSDGHDAYVGRLYAAVANRSDEEDGTHFNADG